LFERRRPGHYSAVLSHTTGPELTEVTNVLAGYLPELRRDFDEGRFAQAPGDPSEKDLMVRLVVRMLGGDGR
jgi:hypothetical protein